MPFLHRSSSHWMRRSFSLVSPGESLVLIHELPNLNHPILIINHSVPWLNLTSLGKQSPFPYFMTFDWLQILSRNLNITGKTVQQHKSRRIRFLWFFLVNSLNRTGFYCRFVGIEYIKFVTETSVSFNRLQVLQILRYFRKGWLFNLHFKQRLGCVYGSISYMILCVPYPEI